MYLQPVVDLASGQAVAVEALARFPDRPELSVGHVFARARAGGGGVELEAACLRAGRAVLPDLPAGVDIAVNVSPDAIDHPLVQEALAGDLHRVIVEVTEQPASDPRRLADALADLRRRGARLAVDDVTTGYAGLMRLAELRPDIIKVDRSAVRAMAGSTEQLAVVDALVSLGRRLGSLVLAEGVESLDDLPLLATLGVDLAQGWAVAAPAPRFDGVGAEVRAACLAARRALLHMEPIAAHPAHEVDIHHVTAELASTAHRLQLDRALTTATYTLGVSQIGVSVLDRGGSLREVIVTGGRLDPTLYRLADYPATAAALDEGVMFEAHVDQPSADRAEQDVLRRLGMSSVLLVPLLADQRRCGVLELFTEKPRRWSGRDIALARILAHHVAYALGRITVG
jgi:EAL domain-containing protein (putative c-di-GMP-specific phosphodiesterase class I)